MTTIITKSENKHHWYDGKFYHKFIAPNQEKLYRIAAEVIPPGSKVLDIACATGGFSFIAASRASVVTGIDLSQKNIDYANRLLDESDTSNIEFLHADMTKLDGVLSDEYDYAFISYALHEMPADARVPALREISKYSRNILIADYKIPQPWNSRGIANRIAEFFAGREHFGNFREYSINGGLEHIIKAAGLKIKRELLENEKNSHIVVVSK